MYRVDACNRLLRTTLLLLISCVLNFVGHEAWYRCFQSHQTGGVLCATLQLTRLSQMAAGFSKCDGALQERAHGGEQRWGNLVKATRI